FAGVTNGPGKRNKFRSTFAGLVFRIGDLHFNYGSNRGFGLGAFLVSL
ncbi:MAG: hypothetical protein ACI9VS_001491, partial [Candidatus Binatia bacterium]